MYRTYGSSNHFVLFFNGLIRRLTDVATILAEVTPLKSRASNKASNSKNHSPEKHNNDEPVFINLIVIGIIILIYSVSATDRNDDLLKTLNNI